jgi:hypothetical protein
MMMMKHPTRMGRSLLGAALVACVMTGALWTDGHAQGADGLSFGLKAGLNSGSFLNLDVDDTSRRSGLTAGGFMDFPLASAVDLRLEALYTQKGITDGTNTVALDYIEVPVLAKFGFGSGGVTPFLYAGPSVGYNVSAKLKSDTDSVDYGDLVKSFESSLAFGGGLGFTAGTRTIELDVRYTMGLTSVFDFGDPSDSDSDDKNQGISATIGIIL